MEKFHTESCKFFRFDSSDEVLASSTRMFIRVFSLVKELDQSAEIEKLLNQKERATMFDFDFSDENDTNFNFNCLKVINSLLPSQRLEILQLNQMTAEVHREISNCIVENPKKSELSSELTQRLMLIFYRNGWTTTFDQKFHLIFMFGSLLNHACVPNTDTMYYGTKQIIYVTEPIKKNEQIYTKYR